MTDITRTDVQIPEPQPDLATQRLRPDTLEVGQWYWVHHKTGWRDGNQANRPETTWTFCCITHLGSNFAKLESPPQGKYKDVLSFRIHFENFFDNLIWVPNAQEVIDGYLSHHHSNLHLLMREMKEVTARLAIAPSRELHAADTETQALSTTLSGQSYGDYKGALVKARDKELPAIFESIKDEHAELAKWMSAQLVPMRAEATKLATITDSIKSRIFNVELYAGLVEEITQVLEGEPAPLTTPLTMIQRRHYMDEECLAHYETGGMQFKHIQAFDKWIARKDNRDRLLPFPRCIVAFRVRHYDIQRETSNIAEFIELFYEREADKKTFLYIRNGEQLFRLSTGIDFGGHLFPDIEREKLSGKKLWAEHSDSLIHGVITDHDYQARVQAWKERVAANEKHRKEWEAEKAAWEATADKKEREKNGYKWSYFHEDTGLLFDKEHFEPFDKTSVFYDDTKKFIQDQIDAHNRIALVIQGLLDRSPVLHPHPPWQLWTEEGFGQALNLIYDDSRALTPGDAPDFEAFRAKLNKEVKAGSVTIGQQVSWEEAEAEKWNAKNPDKDRRWRYRRHDNPGPGHIATVVSKRGKHVSYEWLRKSNKGKKRWEPDPTSPGWGWNRTDYHDIKSHFACPIGEVLNISEYKPGDFKQFFNDPRTRAQYVKWAPYLLAAEEWHAGNANGKPKPVLWTCDGCGVKSEHENRGFSTCSCGVFRYSRVVDEKLEKVGDWGGGEDKDEVAEKVSPMCACGHDNRHCAAAGACEDQDCDCTGFEEPKDEEDEEPEDEDDEDEGEEADDKDESNLPEPDEESGDVDVDDESTSEEEPALASEALPKAKNKRESKDDSHPSWCVCVKCKKEKA